MSKNKPTFAQMIRAPFLSSVYAPILAGTAASVVITHDLDLIAFILVMIMGTGLHAATNVYNDIYDTIQGTDKINENRNEFSGGSGILVTNPDYFPKMYNVARMSLIVAFIATIALTFVINERLYPLLFGLYFLSAFYAKYYTAAPVKLAYRGLGEISVWLAFGPMGVLVASVSQNLGLHESIYWVMPATGLSTMSILWIGQMIDLDADKATGKLGMVSRIGLEKAKTVFPFIHFLIILNIILLPIFTNEFSYLIYIALLPYALILPKILKLVSSERSTLEEIKKGAGLNVQLHLLFSISYLVGFVIQIFV
ncbi:MAG: prenyltransferase [Melioribacteraceae bacterium]|nr:prenyltransferase [Melioribacteraceae bacterium]MCF8265544.1 prenyltransferase [Melioribacteraceae bacterium]MCF8413861.1 prenyltransferase [Melioribacteraceae bacterium]MCF8432039.1 prenyltransferase [Melioribacteraceae bacterium]